VNRERLGAEPRDAYELSRPDLSIARPRVLPFRVDRASRGSEKRRQTERARECIAITGANEISGQVISANSEIISDTGAP
jgi:hypothetical protein